jgi:DNA-binding NarL/FixJ family response regulator
VIRILVVEDHEIVRRGLQQIVAETPDLSLVASAADGRSALEVGRQQKCDVILLDITLPDCGGLELLKELRRRRPSIPILILTARPEEAYGLRAMRAGAAGCLPKESCARDWIRAIRCVAEGRKFISGSLAERLAAHLQASRREPPEDALSDREFEVMLRLARGRSTGEIAAELGLSRKTVSTYRGRVLAKMSLSGNVELAAYALRHGLID